MTLTLILLLAAALHAEVLRVPQDFPTIQSALDSVSEADTVLISRGRYEEALTAPPLRFLLVGVFEPDSGAPRPIVDATGVTGPDTLAALTLAELSVVRIQNLCFRNRERNGITTLADSTELINCVIESTNVGLKHSRPFVGAVMEVNRSEFKSNTQQCILGRTDNILTAIRTTFRGFGTADHFLVLAGHLVLDSCTFVSLGERLLLYVSNSASVTNCVFGPATANPFLSLISFGDECTSVRFANNTLMHCNSGHNVLSIGSTVPDSIEICNNVFRNCRGRPTGAGTLGFVIFPQDATLGPFISGNRFENCSGGSYCDDISPSAGTPVRIENNWFIHDSVNGLPAIGGAWPWLETPITLRNNVFINCGYALHGSPATDAAFNYWGNASGPYHEIENPGGLGDTITGPVSFFPWLEDTVTSAIERPEPIHDWTITAVYPNPFNGEFEIEISGQTSANFSVRLFDLLGRQVALIHEGVVRSSVLHVAAPRQLASGVYFVSARDRQHSVVQKVVLLK